MLFVVTYSLTASELRTVFYDTMLFSSLEVSCFEGNVQPLSQAINEQETGGKHVELELPKKHQ
jgi:hypothetical protein